MVKKNNAVKKSKAKIISNKSLNKKKNTETDSHFFLKSVVFLILGSQWIYIETSTNVQIPIPVGLILGLVLATHEHFQIDRKIEYAILLIASFISFWLPLGLVIQI